MIPVYSDPDSLGHGHSSVCLYFGEEAGKGGEELPGSRLCHPYLLLVYNPTHYQVCFEAE